LRFKKGGKHGEQPIISILLLHTDNKNKSLNTKNIYYFHLLKHTIMKKELYYIAISIIFFASCGNKGGNNSAADANNMSDEQSAKFVANYLENQLKNHTNKGNSEPFFNAQVMPILNKILAANPLIIQGPPSATNNSLSVDTASANVMIRRYLTDPFRITTLPRSFMVSADTLLAYIDTALAHNNKIVYFRFMCATYDNNGNNIPTFVLAGLNANNNYVLYNGSVFEHCLPCPNLCPVSKNQVNTPDTVTAISF
jgi:hypothetical protein